MNAGFCLFVCLYQIMPDPRTEDNRCLLTLARLTVTRPGTKTRSILFDSGRKRITRSLIRDHVVDLTAFATALSALLTWSMCAHVRCLVGMKAV